MCDSMPHLDDEFNFNDINFDFLDSPPRSNHANSKSQMQNSDADALPSSSQPFIEDQIKSQTKTPEQSQQQQQGPIMVKRTSIQDLSKRIADVDTLISQYRTIENERDDFRKQLEELRQSANEVQTLYTNEKQKRMEEKAKTEELLIKYQRFDKELTSKTFQIEQLQAKLDGLKIPIEYDELAVRYLKLIQKLDEDRSVQRCEQAFVREVQKYCREKGLKITPYQQRSPRKRKTSVAKIDMGLQCNFETTDPKTSIQKELRDKSTQCERTKTQNQGCQHIGTTTTRSTTTSCFFKYHDVGVNCNLLDIDNALNEIIKDIHSWSSFVTPLSPIADLVDSQTRTDAKILPPPVPPVEMKNNGTCTYICNVQRSVDYVNQIPTIKRSNSRPASRLMYETVKDESNTCSTTAVTTPLITPFDTLSNRFTVDSAPGIYPSAFNELWQIFGHMLYGLLQRRVDNGTTFCGQTIPENHVTNQQEFYNWLQTLYMDMHGNERDQTHNENQELQDMQNGRSTEKNISEHNTNESTLDLSQQQQHQTCVESPLNFSNAMPVKDTNSEQYLFKPKPTRNASFPTRDDPMANRIDRQTESTSPKRFMISSPICVEMNAPKNNTIENLDTQSKQSRSPSAFTSPKSINQEPEITSKINEKIENELSPKKNDSENLKIVDESPKKCIKTSIEDRGLELSSTLKLNKAGETAVDFLAKFETFNELNNECKSINKEEIQSPIKQTHISNNAMEKVRTSKKFRSKIQKLNHSLFGSETDDTDTDSSNEYNETEPGSPTESLYNSDFLSEFSYDIESDGTDNVHSVQIANECQMKPQTEVVEQHHGTMKRKRKSKFQQKSLKNCYIGLKGKKICSRLGTSSGTSDSDDDLMEVNLEPQISPDGIANSKNGNRVQSSVIENRIQNELNESSERKDLQCEKFASGALSLEENNKIVKALSTNIPFSALHDVKKSLENEVKEEERCSAKDIIDTNYPLKEHIDWHPKATLKDEANLKESSKTEEAESFDSPKMFKTATSNKYERSSSPLSETDSTSSVESRLLIVSDVEDEINEFDSTTTIQKRGCKRKSESASSTPCKRSARLFAKQKLGETNFLSLLNVRKYTRRNHKVNIECEEDHSDENFTEEIVLEDHIELNVSSEEKNPIITTASESNNGFVENENSKNISDLRSEVQSCSIAPKNELTPNASFSSSPASPVPFDSASIDSQSESIKQIPLERTEECSSWRRKTNLLYKLISVYEAHSYRSLNSEQFKTDEKILLDLMVSDINNYFLLDEHNEGAAVQLVNQILSKSQDSKLISHAICSSSQKLERPPTTEYEHSDNETTVPLLYRTIPSNINQNMPNVINELIQKQSSILRTLLAVVESILFNVKTADTLTMEASLNLTEVYLLTLSLQNTTQAISNPARLFIAKCLYYHKIKAIPMIYAVLCKFPSTLPHREEINYDRSDALITVIQHALMCTPYDMEKHQLFHRELLSKLRFVYHFETYKPDFNDVLQNLVGKLRAGSLNNLKYAMAIFCKRLPAERVVRDIVQMYMIPLSQEYYTLVQQSEEYDERTAAMLDCFSFIIKPFPRDTLAVEINNYLNIFKRFLTIVERPIVQEAAVHAILRLQRFSNTNCFNALINFRPDYDLHPHTRAALRTFIHRRPLSFWKSLLNQCG